MYGLPDVFNIFLSKFWRFWMPYFLQYGPNKYQTWRDFTNLGLPFLTIWFCLVSIVNPIRHGLACTCAHVAHVTLLCLLHSTDLREKEGRLAIKVLLECWRFFSGGRGGEGSRSSFLIMIIQKQRANKTAFYASYNLSANLQRQTGKSFFFLAGCKLALYSGILALGIGDTMASIVGKSLGRFRWPGKACLKSCSVLSCHCCMRCVKRNFHPCWGRAWRD